MKANKETTLFTVLTGSHLYGNATSTSDYDYKAVCVPPIDELLLNTKITNRKEKPEGLKQGDTMVAGESETEYLPIQVFLNDFFDGQTYALEVAFAVLQQQPPFKQGGIVEWNPKTPLVELVQAHEMIEDLVDQFLTKNVKKMVGYAVSQSKMYGLKTERYETLVQVKRIIDEGMGVFLRTWQEPMCATLIHAPEMVQNLLTSKHVKMIEVMNGAGGTLPVPGIEICSKQFPMTSRIVSVQESIKKSLGTYGARVKDFEGQGVDWKALSHAIRITEQVLELCSTGELTFPRPNARFLKSIKNGELTLDEATEYLNATFAKVDDAIIASKLPERTPEMETAFRAWKIQVLRNLYEIH